MSNTPIEDEENQKEDGDKEGGARIPVPPDDNAQLAAQHLQETSAALSQIMGEDFEVPVEDAIVEEKKVIEDFVTDDEYDEEDDGEVINDVPPPKDVKSTKNRPMSKATGF